MSSATSQSQDAAVDDPACALVSAPPCSSPAAAPVVLDPAPESSSGVAADGSAPLASPLTASLPPPDLAASSVLALRMAVREHWLRYLPVPVPEQMVAMDLTARFWEQHWHACGSKLLCAPGLILQVAQFDPRRLSLFPNWKLDSLDLLLPCLSDPPTSRGTIRDLIVQGAKPSLHLPLGYCFGEQHNRYGYDLVREGKLSDPGVAPGMFVTGPPLRLIGGLLAPKGNFKYWTVGFPVDGVWGAFWQGITQHIQTCFHADEPTEFRHDIFPRPVTVLAKQGNNNTTGLSTARQLARTAAGAAPEETNLVKYLRLLTVSEAVCVDAAETTPPTTIEEGEAAAAAGGTRAEPTVLQTTTLRTAFWQQATQEPAGQLTLAAPSNWFGLVVEEPVIRMDGVGVFWNAQADSPHFDIRITATLVGGSVTQRPRPSFYNRTSSLAQVSSGVPIDLRRTSSTLPTAASQPAPKKVRPPEASLQADAISAAEAARRTLLTAVA